MKVTETIKYVGVNDHQLDMFEAQYPVPKGMAYNSYVILDEKVAVLDSVEAKFGGEWIENIRAAVGDRNVDYLIIQHMEPDHSANIDKIAEAYPGITIVANTKSFLMLDQFFCGKVQTERIVVNSGDVLSLGSHELQFLFAPMVHWPEVMMTYDHLDKILFSADAFGKFGALDEEEPWEDEARRYYIGIVGKYGPQVQKVLKEAAKLEIQKICSLHGPVLKENIAHYIGLYDKWSSYRPEKEGAVLAYTSVYGNTKAAVSLLKEELEQRNCKVEVYDLCRCDFSAAVAAAFRYDRVVFATTTYNADIFPPMRHFIDHIMARNFQKRKVALIENGSWAPMAKKVMSGMLEKAKNLTYVGEGITIKSAMCEDTRKEVAALAEALCE